MPDRDALREALAQYEVPDLDGKPTILFGGSAGDLAAVLAAVLAALDRSEPAGLREAIERETDAVYPAASPAGPRTPWQDGWNAAMERIDEILADTPTASPTDDDRPDDCAHSPSSDVHRRAASPTATGEPE